MSPLFLLTLVLDNKKGNLLRQINENKVSICRRRIIRKIKSA